jgi:hypothetical protein
MDCLIINVEAT